MSATHDNVNNDSTNDINLFKNDCNNDRIDGKKGFNPLFLTKQELLAMDLAAGLDDEANLRFYFSVCRKYPEEFLRETYGRVREIPLNKIKKSRGALFNYLIQKHEKDNNRN